MKRRARYAAFMAILIGAAGGAVGALNENQVLVIYNSQNSDSVDVYDHYLDTHPNVLGLDLNTTFTSGHTIPYAEYISKIRDPIRAHLNANTLQQQVVVFTLTKGIPHRISDTDNAAVGDGPLQAQTETFTNRDATFATVDSELTLLWRSLDAGEAGGAMDSFSDNFILNPYHAKTQSISNFSRSNIASSKSFVNHGNLFWEMREGGGGMNPTDGGDMYLTARLDGNTVSDVTNMIDRAQRLVYNRVGSKIILDENDANQNQLGWELDDQALTDPRSNDPAYQGNDYEEAYALMSQTWNNITLNENAQFLTGASPPGAGFNDANRVIVNGMIAALMSQGGNHSGSNQSGYLDTFAGQLADGAIMNTIESYNAKDFGGAGGFSDLGQLSKWIALGGTFGVGQAWEPFAISVADNEFLLDNFFNNDLTWVEAAWSGIPYVSWQNLVIGDPLAVVTGPGDADFDGDVDIDDLIALASGYGMTVGATWEDGNFDFDGDVDLNDLATLAYFYDAGQEQALADFQMIANVPEPALTGVLATIGLMLTRRRR